MDYTYENLRLKAYETIAHGAANLFVANKGEETKKVALSIMEDRFWRLKDNYY